MSPKREETSAQTFVRLANSRGSKSIKAIRNMHNLAFYENTPAQRKKIIDALNAEVRALDVVLNAPKGKRTESLFEL